MHTLTTILAFGWEPEIRGLTTVMIGVAVLCGSTFILLATNLGQRLGFLVALAGLTGWMFLMGIIWWVYGIGLVGNLPSWQGQEIIVEAPPVGSGDLTQSVNEVAQVADIQAATVEDEVDGWFRLAEDDPGRAQAIAAADAILVEEEYFAAGEYQALDVFDYGGDRWPVITIGEWDIDVLAFFHDDHFALVEVKPVVPQITEPGKAPPRPIVDENQPSVFVLMERDPGTHRRPSALLTIGSGIIFALALVMLHRRDKQVDENLGRGGAVEKVTT